MNRLETGLYDTLLTEELAFSAPGSIVVGVQKGKIMSGFQPK